MRDPAVEAMNREFRRLNEEMLRTVGAVPVPELPSEVAARLAEGREMAAQQAMLSQALSQIGEIPTQDLLASHLMPAAHELLQPLYEPALASIPGMAAAAAERSVLEETLAGLGGAAMGIGLSVEQMKEFANAASDIRSFTLGMEPGWFMELLPDLNLVTQAIERIREAEGEDALEANDFGFASYLVPREFLIGLASIALPARGLDITSHLTSLTTEASFREELREKMSQSDTLARRWPIVDRALKAHCEDDYFLSIPALLPQVEGAMADALTLKGTVIVVEGKLYWKDPDTGNAKVSKKGRRKGEPIQITGGKQLLQNQPLREHPILQGVADVLAANVLKDKNDKKDKMFDDRNLILHGNSVDYNKAELSTRALLVLLTVAPEITAFEAGKTEARSE